MFSRRDLKVFYISRFCSTETLGYCLVRLQRNLQWLSNCFTLQCERALVISKKIEVGSVFLAARFRYKFRH